MVGVVSYGMYLVHVSAITAAKQLLPLSLRGAPIVFATATLATVAVASASYRWIELPILRLRERFRPTGSCGRRGRARCNRAWSADRRANPKVPTSRAMRRTD